MATLKVKLGVQPRLVDILAGIANVAQKLIEPPEVWITSGIDGVHSLNSLHYALRAADVRTRNFPTRSAIESFAAALRVELGRAYDVVIEKDHLHVEFDPK